MIDNTSINKIVACNKVSFGKKGFKYFIGYKNGKKVRPLFILLPKMSLYWRNLDKTEYMSFLIKYNEWWWNDMKIIIKFEKKSAMASKQGLIVNLHTMIKSYEGKINTKFHVDKILKEDSHFICLSIILIDSVYR